MLHSLLASSHSVVPLWPNNTLQVPFDPLRTFAAAKAHIASNAPERGR